MKQLRNQCSPRALAACKKPHVVGQTSPVYRWPIPVMVIGASQGPQAPVRAMVRQEPGFFLVAESETGAAALALVFRWQPAVVLVEVSLADRNAFEVVKCIRHLVPACAAILLSNAPDPCVQEVARAIGAKAVWHKGGGLNDLRHTLRCLVHNAWFGQPLS